jgi:hypothetical protein
MKQIIILISLLSLFTACSPGMQEIQQKVATDSVKSYELTQKAGDKIELCVKAGMVAEAFNQAHDEKNYLAWKQTEKADCELAGIKK